MGAVGSADRMVPSGSTSWSGRNRPSLAGSRGITRYLKATRAVVTPPPK